MGTGGLDPNLGADAGDRFGVGGAACDAAVAMLADREQREGELIARLASMIDGGSYAADGAVSLSQWLRAKTAMSRTEARRLARTARLVADRPEVAEALARGSVRVGHLDVMARMVTPPRQTLLDRDIDLLLDHASQLPVDDFALVARRWAALADDEAEHAGLGDVDREFFAMARTLFGAGHLSGFLSAESAAIVDAAVTAALEPPDPPDAAGGVRSIGQRRADALVQAVGGRVTAQVKAVIDLDRLQPDAPTCQDPEHRSPFGFTDLGTAGPVDPETIRRMACTGGLARLVVDTPSRIIDYGQSRRLFSAAQIELLAVRDGGCVWPGCGKRPEHCDAHHEPPFPAGPTDLDHAMLLCRRHHRLRHEGRWRLTRAPDGTIDAIHPSGRHAGPGP